MDREGTTMQEKELLEALAVVPDADRAVVPDSSRGVPDASMKEHEGNGVPEGNRVPGTGGISVLPGIVPDASMGVVVKRCSRCGNTYPRTHQYFHRDSHTGSGLYAHCRLCNKTMARNRYRSRVGIPLDRTTGAYRGKYPMTEAERKDRDRVIPEVRVVGAEYGGTPCPEGWKDCSLCGCRLGDSPDNFPDGKKVCGPCQAGHRILRGKKGRHPRKDTLRSGEYVPIPESAEELATPEISEEDWRQWQAEIQAV